MKTRAAIELTLEQLLMLILAVATILILFGGYVLVTRVLR